MAIREPVGVARRGAIPGSATLRPFPRPRWRPWREWRLGAKLAATFLLVVVGVAGLVSVAVIRHERRALDAELRKRAVNLTENLRRLSVDLVLQDDLWGLYKVVRDIASGSDGGTNVVVYAAVLDPAGRVLAHTDPARYPMGERMAEVAGSVVEPAGRVRLRRTRPASDTVYDLTAPIELDKQAIGSVRIGVSTRDLDATIARITRDILLISSGLAALGVALGLVISRRMTRPLRELSYAVDRLGQEPLDEPVAVTTTEKDEIGHLADRFTVMAQRLRETVQEITATKQYLENLLENANDFIYTLDLDGRVTYINHQFLELGLRKDDVVGAPLTTLFVGTANGEARLLPPRPRTVFEVAVTARDGQVRTLVVTESPLVDNEWRPIGTLGIAKDVTERKALETRLIQSERLASVGELAGALAHEIRNPLGALFAAAKMLGAASPQAAGYDRAALLRVITQEAGRLDRILAEFLAFARPRPPQRYLHGMNGLVTEVLDSLRLSAGAPVAQVELALDPALPAVSIDADQIRQVLWNVIRNALEAIDHAGELRITTAVEDGHVVVEVLDSGVGMPAEQQTRLFEPFHTTKPGGSGLGLAIAHRIVTAHDGTIDVRSEPGTGTRVRLLLPREVPA